MATDKSYYTILTDIGKAKIANASLVGEKVDFAKIQLGDGGGNEYNPTEEQTALKNVVWEGNVGNVKTDEAMANCLILESLIPANAGGFIVREIGYLDTEGNLLAISKYRSAYKPKVEDGAVIDMKVKTIFVVSNVNNIELKIDPTIIFATLKDLQDLDTKIDTTKTELTSNIETAKTELNGKIGDTTQLTTTDKTSLVSALNEVKTSVDSIETTAEKTSIKDTDNLFESDNVEGALKEVFQSGVDAKNNVVTALNSKGAEVTTSDTWEEIKNKINDSKCSFDLFETTFNNKRFIINKIFDEDVKEMTLFHNDIDCYFIVAKFYIYKMDSNFNLIYKNRLTYNPDGAYIDENYIYIGDVYNLSKYDKESGNLVSSRTNIGCLYMCGDENYLYTVVTSGLGGVRPSEKFIKIDKLNLSTIVENGDGTDNSTYEFRYHEKFVMNSNNIYFMKTKHKKNSYNDYYQYLCKMNPNTLNIDTQLTIYNNVAYQSYVKGFVFIGDKIYLTKQRNIESALSKTLSVVDKDLNLTELGADTYSPNRDLITDGTYLYSVSAWSSPSRFDLEKINVSDFKKITEYSCHSDLNSFVTLCNNKICFTSSSGICLAILVSNILIQKEGEEL